MSLFSRFPARSDYVPVPGAFFGPLLEEIQDLAEMQCALRTLFLLHRQRGATRFVAVSALAGDVTLLRALRHAPGKRPQEVLSQAMEACIGRGIFLRLVVKADGRQETLLFLNIPANERAIERIRSGELALPQLPTVVPLEETPARRNIFQLYEETVGIITPLVAERLKEVEVEYPASWIEEAFREAAQQNRRRLAYIEAILRSWKEDGRGHGAPGRRLEKVPVSEVFRRSRG